MHMTTQRARPVATWTLIAVIGAICLAACGSSTSSSKTSSAAASGSTGSGGSARPTSAQRTKLQACLKQHGITLPNRRAGGGPPPGGGTSTNGGTSGGTSTNRGGHGGGFFRGGGNSAQAKKLQAAFKACGANFGRGGGRLRRGGGRPSAAALQKFTTCVAQHGYKLPKPSTSGKGPIFPRSIEGNAKFQSAAKACQSDLRPSGGAGGSPPSA
jgi:hypothetical protein